MDLGSRRYRDAGDEGARARLGLGDRSSAGSSLNLLGRSARRPARSRTLTGRGRATLLAIVAVVGVWLGVGLPAGVSGGALSQPVAELPPPEASLVSDATSGGGWSWFASLRGGADAAFAPEPARTAPQAILERLPVSRDALKLSVTNLVDGFAPPRSNVRRLATSSELTDRMIDPATRGRLFEVVPGADGEDLRVEYAFDAELMSSVFKVLKKARVKRGHVVVLDVKTGRVLAYASADPVALPPQRAYPAASLAKVVTGAASLEENRRRARQPCLYRGSPYRLTKSRVNPTRGGNEASLEKAMAGSYNQCFAQLAVHALGADATVAAFERFGWSHSPAVGHEAGTIARGEGDYGLGKLGSGLAPTRITALHAAQLVASLDTGELVEPWWIDRVVDEEGGSLALPERAARRRVMNQSTADELRTILVRTTKRGTARRAFRTRRGYRLGDVAVAGKTGNLSGRNPRARYEWFAGVAPASDPRIAVAVVQAHGHLWWRTSAQIAADVFAELFCEKRSCSDERIARYTGDLGPVAAPLFLNQTADRR